MKTFVLGVVVLASAVAHGQGTVNFENINLPTGLNAPVLQSDGVTALSGPQFMAELLAGPSGSQLSSIAITGFLTGAGAGYFSGGLATINSVAPGATAWMEVRAWNTASGTSFNQAQSSGFPNSWWASSVFPLTTGGAGVNPGPPAILTPLGNSPGYLNSVPEPSVLALVVFGFVVLLLLLLTGRKLS